MTTTSNTDKHNNVTRNKHHRHDNDRSDYSDNEHDDDGEYDNGGNNTRGRDRTENDLLRAQCRELEKIVESLRRELRMKKSLFRTSNKD